MWRTATPISKYIRRAAGLGTTAITRQVYLWFDVYNVQLKYQNGTEYVSVYNLTNEVWWHIRITFDYTSATFDLYLNKNTTYEGLLFYNTSADNLTRIIYYSGVAATGGFDQYFDAIDCSWSPGYFPNRSYTYYGKTYYNTSLWRSQIRDLEAVAPYYGDLTRSYERPTNTSVNMSYRMSADNSTWLHYNGSTWNGNWSAWTCTNLSLQIYGLRYFQVRVLLTTTDPLQTPSVYYIDAKIYLF